MTKPTKTENALRQLIAVSFVLQNMTAEKLANDKVALSLGLQEVAKYIGGAHGLEWASLVEGAIQEIRAKMQGTEDAGDIAAAAIAKMMNKPH